MAAKTIREQLYRALTEEHPSAFFTALPDDVFPALSVLKTIPQDPVHHPEGDVWIHTMMVLDEASLLKDRSRDPYSFMLAALLHDIGKAVTTTVDENGRIHAYGHEAEGVPLARKFLKEYALREADRSYILNLVKNHMRPNTLARDHSSFRAFKKMMRESVCPEDLLLLAEADHQGRLSPEDYSEARAYLEEYYRRWKELTPPASQ